jgi:hypothetical protein
VNEEFEGRPVETGRNEMAVQGCVLCESLERRLRGRFRRSSLRIAPWDDNAGNQ